MEHTIATGKVVTIRVHLLRSSKPQRCPTCGLRRILYAIALYPAGLSPETWQCAEDIGVRVPGASVAPAPLSGDPEPTLWEALDEETALPDKVEDFVASVTAGPGDCTTCGHPLSGHQYADDGKGSFGDFCEVTDCDCRSMGVGDDSA